MNNNIKKRNTKLSIIVVIILIVTLMLTICYSAFSDQLTITGGNAIARSNVEVRVTGVTSDSSYVSNLDYRVSKIINNVSLQAGESITYTVTARNLGPIPVAISDVSFSSSGNTINTISSNIDSTNFEKICDTNGDCATNVVKTFTLTITNNGSALSNTDLDIDFTFTPFYTITYNNQLIGYVLDNYTFEYTFESNTPTSVIVVDGTCGTPIITNDILSIPNVTSNLVLTGTTGGSSNISPEAEAVIEQADPGETVPVTTIRSTEPIEIGKDSSGKLTTGYDPSEGKYYLLSTDYTGKYSSGSTNRPSVQATFEIEDLTWEVWDKYDNKLILISTNPTTSKLSLIERVGYNNGIYFMNSIVDALYGGATGVTGRNLRMTDIEKKIMEYLDSQSGSHTYTDSSGQAIMSEENLIALRKQIDSTYAATSYKVSSASNRIIPVVHGTASSVDFYNDTSIRKLEDVGDNIPTTAAGTTRTSFNSTKLFYTATSLTNYLSASDINMLRANGTTYWIATRVINGGTGSNSFGFRRSNGSGGVTNGFIAISGTGGVSVSTHSLRPVLEIDLTEANVSLVNGKLVFG